LNTPTIAPAILTADQLDHPWRLPSDPPPACTAVLVVLQEQLDEPPYEEFAEWSDSRGWRLVGELVRIQPLCWRPLPPMPAVLRQSTADLPPAEESRRPVNKPLRAAVASLQSRQLRLQSLSADLDADLDALLVAMRQQIGVAP
jgi:hypothetical protein